MTAAASSYADYVSRLKANDPEMFLGSIVWYGVTENTHISHAALDIALKDCGLDTFAPPKPDDGDVFRRLCSAACPPGKIPTGAPGVFYRYTMGNVSHAGGKIFKQIKRESVNENDRKLKTDYLVEIEFDSLTSTVSASTLVDKNTGLPFDLDPAAEGIRDKVLNNFQSEKDHHNAYAMRTLIRKVLDASHACVVRPSGGVYFVIRQNSVNVAGLEKLSAKVPGTCVQSHPLLDDGKQRQMIKEAFEAETVGEIDKAILEIDGLLKGPEVGSTRFQTVFGNMKNVVEKVESYEDLLEEQVEGAQFRLKLYKAKMRDLLNHCKS